VHWHAHSQGQRVNEKANHRFDFRQYCRPACYRNPEDNVIFTGVTIEQQSPRALGQNVKGKFVFARKNA